MSFNELQKVYLSESLSRLKVLDNEIKLSQKIGNEKLLLKAYENYLEILHEGSGNLAPIAYSKLMSTVVNELPGLLVNHSHISLLSLYEQVQWTSKIIPRFFLVIFIGTNCISNNLLPIQEIWNDMNNFIKAIQHPIRGFFIRSYLLSSFMKACPLNDMMDSISNNVIETLDQMNSLWIRMEESKITKDRSSNRSELLEISQVFIKCLNIGMKPFLNNEKLTKILFIKLIKMIQEHPTARPRYTFIKTILEIFPPKFLINQNESENLEILLENLRLLPSRKELQVEEVFILLLNKLFILESSSFQSDLLFILLFNEITFYQEKTKNNKLVLPLISFYIKLLLKFDIKGNYIGPMIQLVAKHIKEMTQNDYDIMKSIIIDLISFPFEKLLIEIESLSLLIKKFSNSPSSSSSSVESTILVYSHFIQGIIKQEYKLTTIEQVEVVFNQILFPLLHLKEEKETIRDTKFEEGDEVNKDGSETFSLMKIMNMIHLSIDLSFSLNFQFLLNIRRFILNENVPKLRFLLIPLIYKSLEFLHKMGKCQENSIILQRNERKLLQFIYETIMEIKIISFEISFKLLLNTFSTNKDGKLAQEFITSSFDILETLLPLYDDESLSLNDENINLFFVTLASHRNLNDYSYLNSFICERIIPFLDNEVKVSLRNQPELLLLICKIFFNSFSSSSLHLVIDFKIVISKNIMECISRGLNIAGKYFKNENKIIYFLNVVNFQLEILSKRSRLSTSKSSSSYSFITIKQIDELIKIIQEDLILNNSKSFNHVQNYYENTKIWYEIVKEM